jgi:hypothetical protein
MSSSTPSPVRRAASVCALALTACLSGGCAVVTVAGAAASLAITGVGLAADAAVGAVKLTGKAVGAAADAVTPSGGDEPR